MMIFGIDPGITTGIAVVSPGGELIGSDLTTTVGELCALIEWKRPKVVVIEDFVGSGPRTIEAKSTLILIGAVVGVCFLFRIPIFSQVPQVRVPFVHEAEELAPKGTSKHIIAAYSHVLAFLEREAPNARPVVHK